VSKIPVVDRYRAVDGAAGSAAGGVEARGAGDGCVAARALTAGLPASMRTKSADRGPRHRCRPRRSTPAPEP